ncbi:MAG: hypothetical protein KBD63_06495 [Bacteriovoracaceae bacterium]|nr:hypothetical protein [Bacteriovoracaceae bacterium]
MKKTLLVVALGLFSVGVFAQAGVDIRANLAANISFKNPPTPEESFIEVYIEDKSLSFINRLITIINDEESKDFSQTQENCYKYFNISCVHAKTLLVRASQKLSQEFTESNDYRAVNINHYRDESLFGYPK